MKIFHNICIIFAFAILLVVSPNAVYAADGEVTSFQKISDTEGSFDGTLADNDNFGTSVADIGDLNNDGVDDFVVGVENDDTATGCTSSCGAIWILFMNADGTVSSNQKITEGTGDFAGDLEDADLFGSSVAGLGDLDGDGVEDIVVGARGDDDGSKSASGAVYILFMEIDGTTKAGASGFQKISNDFGDLDSGSDVLQGDAQFGIGVAKIGDLDNDGIIDIVVGASAEDLGGDIDAGAVYILFLGTDGKVDGQQKIHESVGGFTGVISQGDAFGTDVEGIGDINGDGNEDIAVGSSGGDEGGGNLNTQEGAIWIIFLDADGTVLDADTDGVRIEQGLGGFTGQLDVGDSFGFSVANIGDVNGDGVIDLAVGAPEDDDGNASGNRGAVWILFMDSDGTVLDSDTDGVKISDTEGSFTGTLDDNDNFGRGGVAALGDHNGDGKNDIAVGAYRDDDGNAGGNRGAVWILFLDGVAKSTASSSKHSDDGGKPPSFGLDPSGGTGGFDNRPQLDHAIKYNGFEGGPFGPGLNHNPLIQIETGNMQPGFAGPDGQPRLEGELGPDGQPRLEGELGPDRFDGIPDELNEPRVNNILEQRGDFSTKLKDLFDSQQSEQSFVNAMNLRRDLEQIDTIIGQHHAFTQEFSNVVEQHRVDGLIDETHDLNRILDEQQEFPDKLKKLFDERNQIRGNAEVETREHFLATYDGVAREVDTIDNYFSENPGFLLGAPVAPPQEVLRAFERLDRVNQDNREVVNRLNPDQVARFGNISQQMAETISEIRRIMEPIETVTFSDDRRTIPNIRFLTHQDEQIPEDTNDISQKLDKLRQLQNQLKLILDEIPDDQKKIDDEIQLLLDEQAQLPSQIEELLSELPETQEFLPPSNLMEIKFKDDRGISNIYYVKIHLGVPAAYKIGETTITYYPNSDPYAIARGQEHGSYIKLNDPEGILDHNNIEIATKQVDCFTDSGDNECVSLEFGHDFLQRPTYPFVGVEVVTLAKYKAYFLINDGIDVIGESKGPKVTQIITDPYDKYSTQITLTRADRIQDLWQDENDNAWTRNTMGSWIKMTHKDYHDFIDKLDSKYNRLDGNYEKLIGSESIKAKDIFDSSLIQQKIKSVYEIKMNEIHHRSTNPELQNDMMNELDKAKLIWNDELYFERHSLNPDYEEIFGKTSAEQIRYDAALKTEQERITLLEQYEPYDLWNSLSKKYGKEFVSDFKNDLENKKNLTQGYYFSNNFN